MKTNEIIAAMQKNLTALMEQQANEVSEYEDVIKVARTE